MNLSEAGLALIKRWEGLKLDAYQDGAGVWTIGYGSTRGVTPGMRITRAEADARLRSDAEEAAAAVRRSVRVPLSQAQFDALVSWTFNLGTGALASSTLLRRLNRGDYEGAAEEIQRWNKLRDAESGELVVSQGLVNRRRAEREMFSSYPLEWAAGGIETAAAEYLPNLNLNEETLVKGAAVVGSLALLYVLLG
jgi:lysozyme